ncbi:pilus assembly protein [Rhodanobacter thiooxydans]|uniref:pilus assembly protein n=1 Tax=Rhodanobacter thiooxydans TaxID=416169 RepID=UPI000D3475DA|nr:PilC/PilY family type IV pilus protein [Rhodanobacter thiooxydans]
MNITSRPHRRSGRSLGRVLSAGLSVWMLGVACSPALATVPVDQAPLIIQKPLPPNVVLMLDDSGSMGNDYMPDDLSDTSLGGYRNSGINGVYYNPAVVYAPPPRADGTSYPDSPSITGAYKDGFRDTSTIDVTQFKGSFNYYTRFLVASAGTYIYKYFFTYTTGSSNTPHYVGQSGDCASLPSASQAVCDDSSATQQNVANWFSYYRTRMLMAKSGVMSAFSAVESSFRVGFGSIGGSNAGKSSLGDDYYAFTTTAHGDTYQTGIALVKPFGDGTSGTQKSRLWSWLADTKPTSWTPLRGALDAVGKYYGTQQPWLTLAGESGYVSGTNTELACRQSYSILTTDGFWNGSTPGNIGNVDNTAATLSGSNNQTYTYTPAAPYSDSTSDTLADVAMKYWVTDLRGSTPNEVPTSTEDPAFWQHMTTFTLGMGFAPTGIKPTGTTVDQIFKWANGGAPIANFSWPTPSSDSQNNIADLAHAAVDGHGGFYSATSPEAFASGLKDALKRASERVGTGASLAANSTQLKTGTVAYQANYYTAKWKGDLKALAVDPNTGAIAATPTWTAAGSLPAAANRNIWTYNPAATGKTSPYVVFQNSAGSVPPALSTAQLSALGSTAATQASMVNYLRGDATLEQKNAGGTYRNRDTPLGDIVDSQPVYVGAPDPNLFANQTFTGSSTYLAFASGTTDNQGNFTPSTAASRAGLIYVAANDGMLHGFDATTGTEKFAFIPGAVLTAGSAGGLVGLSQLSSPDYGTTSSAPHQYFNDGELTVADVYLGSAWKTVLVGTTGRGLARAVYAFDITDPTKIAFLWERSAADGKTNSNYIGQMSGKPVVAQTADSTWSVLIGNGYNSTAGVSALLQFDLATGALNVHATTDTTTDNGLAAPGVWMDPAGTGVSTVAYAGDLHGNVWSFTLNTGSSTSTSTPGSTGSLLFVARDSSSNLQPITGGMLVGRDPASGNTWVFFGTGQYLSTSDLTNAAIQSWYGLIVRTTNATNSPAITSSMTRTNDLVQRAVVAETAGNPGATPPVLPARAVTPMPTSSDMTGKSGWYMDLLSPTGAGGANVAQGERMVTSNQFQGNLLLGTTRIPQATDICNPSGSGWIMAINPFTGTNPSGNFFDVNGDGLVNASDTVAVGDKSYPAAGIGFSSLPNNPIFVGGSMLVSFDNGSNSSITTSGSTGSIQRVSWRELINK